MTDRPDKPGYWWCQGEKDDGIWLVMQDGRITDGAFIYSPDELDGQWTAVMSPEEIDAALEQARAEERERCLQAALDALETNHKARASVMRELSELVAHHFNDVDDVVEYVSALRRGD